MLCHAVRCFTKSEVDQLYMKARNYVDYIKSSDRPEFYPCSVLYRTKPYDYFHKIKWENNNIMKPYIKDNNGDPRSPINGRINGLFFLANVDFETKEPFPRSPYGNTRLMANINAFDISSSETRLYFADFFCRKREGRFRYKRAHSVTLVLTKTGTAADMFCQDHLVELDKTCNPFLRKSFYYTNAEVSGSGVWIEILYTESIDINNWETVTGQARFMDVRENCRAGAAEKDRCCGSCNLDVTD
jgi:hypothetical protein